jgi:hypothetical protein
MRLNRSSLAITFTPLVCFILFVCGSSCNRQNYRTDYGVIRAISDAFKKLKNNGPKLPAPDSFIIDASTVDTILANPKDSFVLAVIGIEHDSLHVDIVASNELGTALSPNIPTDSLDKLKGRHKAFKTKVHKNDHDKSPWKLDDFPLVIKMDKSGLHRIKDSTSCKYYIFYPSIEEGWNTGHDDPQKKHYKHFTLSVLGSNPTNNQINPVHYQEKPSPNNILIINNVKSLYNIGGEETWPEQNFTWYSTPQNGIYIPDTEPQ